MIARFNTCPFVPVRDEAVGDNGYEMGMGGIFLMIGVWVTPRGDPSMD
jgi:hypothetical protein